MGVSIRDLLASPQPRGFLIYTRAGKRLLALFSLLCTQNNLNLLSRNVMSKNMAHTLTVTTIKNTKTAPSKRILTLVDFVI